MPWNPFRDLNNLPDKPRLGVKLMLAGAGFSAVRYAWPSVAPSSFRSASAVYLRWKPYIPHRGSYPPNQWTLGDFGDLLVVLAILLFLCGAFIFLRRGFWWVAENREEKSITQIDLK
jgi:hypothetical protein